MGKDTLNFLDKYNKLNNNSLNILDKEIKSQKKRGGPFEYKNLVKIKEILIESNRDKILKIQNQLKN